MSKTNEKNIIWNSKGENDNIGFFSIEIPENYVFIRNKRTGELAVIDKEEQAKLLVNGLSCYHTDKDWFIPENFSQYHGHNNIYFSSHKRQEYVGTIGEVLKKIRKIEHLLPIDTELSIINKWYLDLPNVGYKSLNLKYKTTRKFKGFKSDGFKINHESTLRTFTEDKLLGSFITFLRNNGFNIFVHPNVGFIYGLEPGEQAVCYGHGLKIGFSEFDNTYRGYSCGVENILFDKEDQFNKWSQCIEIPKPKNELEFEKILKTMLTHNFDEE